MALVNCTECGAQISDAAKACPSCGHPRSTLPKSSSRKWPWIVLPLAVLVGFIAIAGRTPASDEKAKLRRAIASCWREQSRKSLAPEQALFIAGACEKMQADYRGRFRAEP
jgi:hypothetical protein